MKIKHSCLSEYWTPSSVKQSNLNTGFQKYARFRIHLHFCYISLALVWTQQSQNRIVIGHVILLLHVDYHLQTELASHRGDRKFPCALKQYEMSIFHGYCLLNGLRPWMVDSEWDLGFERKFPRFLSVTLSIAWNVWYKITPMDIGDAAWGCDLTSWNAVHV